MSSTDGDALPASTAGFVLTCTIVDWPRGGPRRAERALPGAPPDDTLARLRLRRRGTHGAVPAAGRRPRLADPRPRLPLRRADPGVPRGQRRRRRRRRPRGARGGGDAGDRDTVGRRRAAAAVRRRELRRRRRGRAARARPRSGGARRRGTPTPPARRSPGGVGSEFLPPAEPPPLPARAPAGTGSDPSAHVHAAGGRGAARRL